MAKILVAEDEPLQKLSLIDILTLCNYDVEAVDNGKMVLESLRANPTLYDLVLLDIIMPEMDGLECLEQIMNEEQLKDIPVVMMSANEEKEFISASLAKGAVNYMVKPLRIATVKKLHQYTRSSIQAAGGAEKALTKGLQNYQEIRELGHGAAGSVSLVKYTGKDSLGQEYALKRISLITLGPKETKMAENEVQLLKVLVGPTIIRYYDSYTTKESISIIMEYADGGGLSEKLKSMADMKQKVDKDMALNWIAQVTLGIMIMHSKKILHRDIKTQNLFLVKMDGEEVVKIGDFGISKELNTISDMAKTACGTPYFMSPEVVKGEPYNAKSDMWALGCVLYELVTFNKPFDSDSVIGLYEEIKNKEFRPLPADVDPKIKMLILSLLNKDPNKRYSVWDFARVPEIHDRIIAFVERHKCADQVADVLELDTKLHSSLSKELGKEEEKHHHVDQLNLDRVDEMIDVIRSSIKLQSVKIGWFKKYDNCVKGSELVDWSVKEYGHQTEVAIETFNGLLDKGVIYNVEGHSHFENSERAYYKFQIDRTDIAANMVCPWNHEYHKPLQVSTDLLNKIISVYQEVLQESEEGKFYIDYEELAKQSEYSRYISLSAELQGVNLSSLTKTEKIMFFLNIYQCMYIHYLFKFPPQPQPRGFLKKITSLLWNTNKRPEFYYNISGMNFTLDEIKHGILRGNKKKPGSMFRMFSSSDKRNMLPEYNDCRILFLALDYPEIPEQLIPFKPGSDINEKLNNIAREYINETVCFDDYNGELVLPAVLQTYSNDFARTEAERIKWIWKYFTGNSDYYIDKRWDLLK